MNKDWVEGDQEPRFIRRVFLKTWGAGTALIMTGVYNDQSTAIPRNGKGAAMDIKKNGSQPSIQGPEDWFTGQVRVDPLFAAKEPSRVSGASVTFEPGARTAWHTHPVGQHLIITSGFGWVQRESQPIEEVRPGDVVWFPPGVRHWHGASPKSAMTHIAIQEGQDGSPVTWLEHVAAENYGE